MSNKSNQNRTEMLVRYIAVQKFNNVKAIRDFFWPNRYCFLHFCILDPVYMEWGTPV